MKHWRRLFPLVILLMAWGCGGFRGGVMSAPYVGEKAPDVPKPSTPYEKSQLERLSFPGVDLSIALNNTIRTYEFEVCACLIPMYVNPLDKPYFEKADRLTVSLWIMPKETGFLFRPGQTVLYLDGRPYKTTKVLAVNYPAVLTHPTVTKEEIKENVILLSNIGKGYRYDIIFEVEVATPDKMISIDLSEALPHESLPKIPLIKFRKIPWSGTYG